MTDSLRTTTVRTYHRLALAIVAALTLPSCEESAPEPGETQGSASSTGETETRGSTSESESDSSSETGDEPQVGWFDVGFGETTYEPIEEGGQMHIVWGNQGAAMFPMPIRAGEFTLPDDPKDFTDEKAPILDLTIDIEGFNEGVGGHFKRIANYPVAFDVLGDGTYEFIYVRVIVPDIIDPSDLDGLPAHLWVQIDPWDSAPLEIEYDLTVVVDDPPF